MLLLCDFRSLTYDVFGLLYAKTDIFSKFEDEPAMNGMYAFSILLCGEFLEIFGEETHGQPELMCSNVPLHISACSCFFLLSREKSQGVYTGVVYVG